MEHFIMELYQQPSLCWLAARCPSWESLVPFSARGNLHVSSEAALSGPGGPWSVGGAGWVTELPRHRGQSPVSSPSSAWRAFKQTICIQTLNFFFHALKFVPWLVLLFSHYDTFLGRQNFSHLPHKTLLQIQILKACYAIGNF